MNKYRSNKIKREHSIIEHGWDALVRIAEIEEVDGIIPGVINRQPGQRKLELRFQYFTDQGLKLQMKNPTSIQEVFVVSGEREKVLERLRAEGILTEKKEKSVKAEKAPRKKVSGGKESPKSKGTPTVSPKKAKPNPPGQSLDERIARAAGAGKPLGKQHKR